MNIKEILIEFVLNDRENSGQDLKEENLNNTIKKLKKYFLKEIVPSKKEPEKITDYITKNYNDIVYHNRVINFITKNIEDKIK